MNGVQSCNQIPRASIEPQQSKRGFLWPSDRTCLTGPFSIRRHSFVLFVSKASRLYPQRYEDCSAEISSDSRGELIITTQYSISGDESRAYCMPSGRESLLPLVPDRYRLSHFHTMGEGIRREIVLDPSVIPPLDESLLRLSEEERDFLHRAITPDDEELRKRIVEVQRT